MFSLTGMRHSPLLRYFLLGLVLYFGEHYFEWQASYQIEAPGKGSLALRYEDWARRSGVYPNEVQQTEIRKAELVDRVLFAEAMRGDLFLDDPVVHQRLLRNAAFLGIEGSDEEVIGTSLSLGLHKSDELIRRPPIQQVEKLGRQQAYPLTESSLAALQTRYHELRERWKLEPRIEIHHIFFSGDQSGADARAAAVLAQLAAKPIGDELAYALGDQFLLGNEPGLMVLPKLRDMFGEAFSKAIARAVVSTQQPSEWIGPIKSAYGVHLAKIIRFEAVSYRSFEDVKNLLMDDYVQEAEQAALSRYTDGLLDKYEFESR